MPVILIKETDEYELLVWRITEPLSFFLEQLPRPMQDLPSHVEQRNLEWLASRYLLTQLIENPQVYKTAAKKPFLENDSRYISISHTESCAAVMMAHQPCGIDIEYDHTRITKIAHKFEEPPILVQLQGKDYQSNLYKIWCAKEAMYKAYGLGQIDFKKHLMVNTQDVVTNQIEWRGSLITPIVSLQFKLNYVFVESTFHLVYALQV